MRATSLCCLALGLLLSGCVEVDEHFTFDAKGGGTYALKVAWDADLWRRAREALGSPAAKALQRKAPVPLRVAPIRDGLRDLPGVAIQELTEGTAPDGRRTLSLRVQFDALASLWRWEVLARRPMRLSVIQGGGQRTAQLAMQPLRHLTIVDDAVSLRALVRRDPAQVTHPRGRFATWGLDRERLALLWDMVKVAIGKTVYRVRVDVPGTVRATNENPSMASEPSARFAFDWNALRKGARARRFSLTWSVSELDTVRPARHRMPARK